MSTTITMPLTYELLQDRADSLNRHAAQVRPVADRLEGLRVFVRDCLRLPEDCRDLVAEVRQQAFDELLALSPGSTVDASALLEKRRRTEQVLDALAGSIEWCLRVVEAPAVRTKFLGDARALREAWAEVRRLRNEFSENFPLLNEPEWTAARAERGRDEGLELDEAFAGLAGCSKEEWLARVQAREPKRPEK